MMSVADWVALAALLFTASGAVVGGAVHVAKSLASLTASVEHLRVAIEEERTVRRMEIAELRSEVRRSLARVEAGHASS